MSSSRKSEISESEEEDLGKLKVDQTSDDKQEIKYKTDEV